LLQASDQCASAVVSLGPGGPTNYIVLGTPFLRAYYTIYKVPDAEDLSTAQIGFASAAGTDLSSFLGL
jgi:hypothetical protein